MYINAIYFYLGVYSFKLSPNFALLLVLSQLFGNVFAALYPTCPVSGAVYEAGNTVSLTWTDDHSTPPLDSLGPLKINLYKGASKFVTNLASNVNPKARSQSVFIPPAVGEDGSDFYIAFVPHNVAHSIYSADFTITGMTGASNISESVENPPPGDSASSGVSMAGNSTMSANSSMTANTTTTSKPPSLLTLTLVMPSTTETTVMTNAEPGVTPSTTLYYASSTPGSTGAGNPTGTTSAKKSDSESVQQKLQADLANFKIVFVLWPLLIGLALVL